MPTSKFTYQALDEFLGKKDHKFIKRSEMKTWAERDNVTGNIAIWMHETKILDYCPSGEIKVDSGGWLTVSTKSRLNEYLPKPYSIDQRDGLWFLESSVYMVDKPAGDMYEWEEGHRESLGIWPFVDGMIICRDGTVDTMGVSLDDSKQKKKDLDKYIKGFVEALMAGEVPAPGPRDCWMCSMFDGATGLPVFNTDHILSHIEESYYVPRLLYNAVEEGMDGNNHSTMSPMTLTFLHELWYGNEPAFRAGWEDLYRRQITSTLRKYLKRQLGLPF